MRIKQIEINGLFDMFNHTITLNNDSKLTIVYGENGIGKTMVMHLLHAFFSTQPLEIFQLYLKNFKLLFEDNNSIELKCSNSEIQILYNNEVVSPQNVELIALRKAINVQFVEIDRLKTITQDNSITGIVNNNSKISIQNTASLCAIDLAKKIKEKHTLYNKKSDDLKESLNQRVIEKKVKTNISFAELKEIANDVEKKKAKYQAVGLIADKNGKITIPDDIDEVNKAILAVNIQDIQNQLAIYEKDNFYEKLRLFIEILNNRRLTYKSIKVSENKGFTFTNDKGKDLKPESLSSGEQHELVLLYQLLFKIPENSLILIDEPEISLHITWQKEFTNDMEDIIKLRNFDVLLATHSPAIINGNWAITQSLNGYEETE